MKKVRNPKNYGNRGLSGQPVRPRLTGSMTMRVPSSRSSISSRMPHSARNAAAIRTPREFPIFLIVDAWT
jgi:hypothetical protein